MGEGTVNDEELVEVIAEAIHKYNKPKDMGWRVLAALRSAGFQVFKPEDCDQTTVASELKDGSGYCWFGYQPAGVYALVPLDALSDHTEGTP